MVPASRSWSDILTTAAATLLLALFWWLAVSASIERSPTSDEVPHIASGYAFNRLGDFRLQPENGVLPQRLFGLPPLLEGAQFSNDQEAWNNGRYWMLGWDFFYALPNPTDWFVFAARSLNALFGVALGAFTFALARAWHGRVGGLLALTLFTFSPNLLAHAALATSDIAGALMLLLAPWCFWRHLERRDLPSGLIAGAATGLAFVAKFNAVLLVPIFALLGIGDAWLRGAGGERVRRLTQNVALACVQALLAALVIWAFFNFRFGAAASGEAGQRFAWDVQAMFAEIGWKSSVITVLNEWRVLPEAWLYGFTHVLAGAATRSAFMAGEYSNHGWWEFFPTIVLVKTTLGALGAIAAGFGLVIHATIRANPSTRRAWVIRTLPLVVATTVIWAAAISSNLNIGDRHIIAVYPALYIAAGALGARRWLRWLACALIVAHVHASSAIRPHYLAFFNRIAGGPEKARHLFVDSALDWGQDLPGLERWLNARRLPDENVYLAYFGTAWPPYYGVRPTHFLPIMTYLARPPLVPYELKPGLYCISATALSEVYSTHRGAWNQNREAAYQSLRARFEGVAQASPADMKDYAEFDLLRFARLCKFLQQREPDANVGYSILIYRLDRDDLQHALRGPVKSRYWLRMPQ